MARSLLLFAPLALLVACENPCQEMCTTMATYASSCGYSVPDGDVETCKEANATPLITAERANQCIEASDPEQLREWWTCEDLKETYTTLDE